MSTDRNYSPGSSVREKITPAVSGSSNTRKYAAVIFIAIIAAIVGQVLFRHTSPINNEESRSNLIQTADNSAVSLDLGTNPAQEAAKLPILPTPRAIHVPSILPPPGVDAIDAFAQADETRLKSPSLVYSTSQAPSAANTDSLQNTNNPNENFLAQAANSKVVTVSAKQVSNIDYKILQGKLIPAVLETAINSDLPGMVRAVVSNNVYGDTGRVILLPKGTRLIGQYNSSIAVGQTRVMIAWTRAITPQHVDIALGSPSTDALGEAGMTGIVNTHFWKIFGTSALLSVLGVAGSSTNIGGNTNSNLGVYGNPYQAAVVQGVMNTSGSVLQTRANIQPTIHISQGSVIQVFVARDLDFSKIASYQNADTLIN